MKAKDIIEMMNNWAKPSLIDTWDNTGFQVGNEEKQIKKLLISLDLDISKTTIHILTLPYPICSVVKRE